MLYICIVGVATQQSAFLIFHVCGNNTRVCRKMAKREYMSPAPQVKMVLWKGDFLWLTVNRWDGALTILYGSYRKHNILVTTGCDMPL